MARNRKRAKDRRARRPAQIAAPRVREEPDAPAPLEHAAPDVELAEAQLAVGRPETDDLPGDPQALNGEVSADEAAGSDDELALDDEDEFVDEASPELTEEDNGALTPGRLEDAELEHLRRAAEPSSSMLPSYGRAAPDADPADTRGVTVGDAGRTLPGSRLVSFLQGSWNELQRVQWPDRRQVLQATGVVIGFVIVAGLFLGLADLVASKLVTFIIGH